MLTDVLPVTKDEQLERLLFLSWAHKDFVEYLRQVLTPTIKEIEFEGLLKDAAYWQIQKEMSHGQAA